MKIVLRVRTRGRRIEGGRSRALRALGDGRPKLIVTLPLESAGLIEFVAASPEDERRLKLWLASTEAMRTLLPKLGELLVLEEHRREGAE